MPTIRPNSCCSRWNLTARDVFMFMPPFLVSHKIDPHSHGPFRGVGISFPHFEHSQIPRLKILSARIVILSGNLPIIRITSCSVLILRGLFICFCCEKLVAFVAWSGGIPNKSSFTRQCLPCVVSIFLRRSWNVTAHYHIAHWFTGFKHVFQFFVSHFKFFSHLDFSFRCCLFANQCGHYHFVNN